MKYFRKLNSLAQSYVIPFNTFADVALCNWGEPERAPQFGGSSSSSAMHYGAFVVRTYTELFLQWFKSYRLFASHRLCWELSVLQWFTVNFTGLSPFSGSQFFMRQCVMRCNIFFMPNNKWKLEWSVLFTVVSIIKPIAILLYSISEWVAVQILIQSPIWFGLYIL
jgi:hypothetical protein